MASIYFLLNLNVLVSIVDFQEKKHITNFFGLVFEKISHIRETLNLAMCADSSTDTMKSPLFGNLCQLLSLLALFQILLCSFLHFLHYLGLIGPF